jgi:probable phosphoglycerate mutase
MATIYIVRHGETEWNVIQRLQGHFDSTLTEAGIERVLELARELEGVRFDAIFSSDLLRAKRTAELIRLDRKMKIITSKLLRERAYGRFDGMMVREYAQENKHLFELYQKLSLEQQWKFKFGEGYESDEEVVSRFTTFLREIAATYAGKTILVVSHGALIKTFLAHLGEVTPAEARRAMFVNAGYLEIESDGTDFFLKKVSGFKKQS